MHYFVVVGGWQANRQANPAGLGVGVGAGVSTKLTVTDSLPNDISDRALIASNDLATFTVISTNSTLFI